MDRLGQFHSEAAAFFDVDGTLVSTNIVHYYVFFRRRLMPPLRGACWQAGYGFKCAAYLVLDRLDRGRLNRIFYRDYRNLPVETVKAWAKECHERVILPARFPGAFATIEAHRAKGDRIVLVTGSLDFIVAPLAREVGAGAVIAATLQEADGRFTGHLEGPALAGPEKARRVAEFASQHGLNLAACHAYGDGIADLPMLEAVGHPHAVNPDRALARVAARREWTVHNWSTSPDSGICAP